jgi:hypothetical protein
MLAPSQAEAATVTINPRPNAVEVGQVLAAPDGSVFTITVYDAGLDGGQKAVTHTYVTGNTLRQTANKIVQAINADTDLQAIGVTAALGTGSNYTINSTSTNGTVYKQTTTGGGTNRLAIQQTLTIGGTVTVDDKLTLTIYDAGLVGGKEAVVYKSNTGDTLGDIVIRLRNKINNSTTLDALGISAKVSPTDPNVLLIESPTFDATEKFTSYSAKVKAGGTETMTLGSFWGTNGAQTISVAGPVVVGETVEFTVFNANLPDEQKTVSYVVQAGDNLNQIRCGLRTELNNDSDLAAIGVHATCAGGVLTVTSTDSAPGAYGYFPKIPCVPVEPNPTKWPAAAQVKICRGASLSSASLVRDTLENLGDPAANPARVPYAATKLSANGLITFYVYNDHNDFYQSGHVPFFRETGGPDFRNVGVVEGKWSVSPDLPVRSKILGYTIQGQFSLIFETSRDKHETVNDPTNYIANNYIRHATAHEFGHQFSFLAGSGGQRLDESAAFQNAWNMDMALMARASSCRYNAPLYQTEPPMTQVRDGIFTGAVGANGQYICGSDGFGFGGGNPVAVMNTAYPYFGQTPVRLSEIFPEVFANVANYLDTEDNSGNPIPGNSSIYTTTNTALVCTNLYVSTWAFFGRDPDSFELSASGYSIPDGDHTIFAACDGHEEREPNSGA